jgi:hypothetical protein
MGEKKTKNPTQRREGAKGAKFFVWRAVHFEVIPANAGIHSL